MFYGGAVEREIKVLLIYSTHSVTHWLMSMKKQLRLVMQYGGTIYKSSSVCIVYLL